MDHEQTLRDIVREYSAWTSTHGIPHIVLTENPFLRAIWAVLTLGAFGAAIYQVVTLFIRYFAYSVIVQPNTVLTPLTFPTVTFCNTNAWKYSKIAGTPLRNLVETFEQNNRSPASNEFERMDYAKKWMWLMGEALIRQAKRLAHQKAKDNFAYDWDELFISCTYNEKACDARNFTVIYDVHYGRCFQFNTNGLLNSTRAAPTRGLRVVWRSDQSEYLPWTQNSGVVVGLTTFGRPVFMETFGYFAPVSAATMFALNYLRRTKLDNPFSNCTFTSDSLQQPIYYDSIYTVESCLRSCIQDNIMKRCRCYAPHFSTPFNRTTPSCYDVARPDLAIACIDYFIHAADSKWNVYDNCACPFACDQSEYVVTTSSAKWPANAYTLPECLALSESNMMIESDAGSISHGQKTQRWFNLQDCKTFYKENALMIDIFFNTITMQIQEEDQGYKIINFIADAGGATGLWLGMSVVSIIEAFLFICVVIRFLIFRPKTVRIDPGYDYFATFKNLEQFGNGQTIDQTAAVQKSKRPT